MKLRISHILVSVALGVTGCAVQGPSDHIAHIARGSACAEQADAWCPAVGFDNHGCRQWYVGQCSPGGSDGSVDARAQDECLRDIADMVEGPLGWDEPATCKATWIDS